MSRPLAQPLRPLTEPERQELQRVSHAPSEAVSRHRRAIALLAVVDGMSLIEAARTAGWRVHDTVTRLIRRFHERGLAALNDLPRSGHPHSYGASARARIEQELLREPFCKEDSTATWSLCTLQRALREASDGLPRVSTLPLSMSCMKRAIPGSKAVRGVRPVRPCASEKMARSKKAMIPTPHKNKQRLNVPISREKGWDFKSGVRMKQDRIRPFPRRDHPGNSTDTQCDRITNTSGPTGQIAHLCSPGYRRATHRTGRAHDQRHLAFLAQRAPHGDSEAVPSSSRCGSRRTPLARLGHLPGSRATGSVFATGQDAVDLG